jgi:catechol 2,3-dioxygenase-like lactoylglutathione lyase family enzyme
MDFEVSDVDHVAVRVSDVERALAFYHGVLGLPVRDREAFEAGDLPFVAVAVGGRHLHLFPTDGEFDPGNEHVCLLLRSDDTDTREAMDALLADLRDADVEIVDDEPVERLGAYGRDWAVYVRDPDGRIVELKLH